MKLEPTSATTVELCLPPVESSSLVTRGKSSLGGIVPPFSLLSNIHCTVGVSESPYITKRTRQAKGKGKAKAKEINTSFFSRTHHWPLERRCPSQRLEGWRTLSQTQSLSCSWKLHCIPIKKLLIFYRANAFALFLKSQRKWASSPLSGHSVLEFKKKTKEFEDGISEVSFQSSHGRSLEVVIYC